MAPLILEGDTLGQKHEHYNKYVNDIVTHKVAFQLTGINMEENDVENLLKIDLASHNRDVDYILEVLKCKDMLYVSRAVKKCTWLITDPHYEHIINPGYLQSQLFPEMSTKAIIKLMLQIRLKLKDEKRAENFYVWIEDKSIQNALKWLPKCSVPFIEKEVEKHADLLELNLFKRLCERSFTVLEIYNRAYNKYRDRKKQLELSKFFIRSNMDEYMDIVDLLIDPIHPIFRWKDCPKFGKRTTNIIMKNCPERIIDKFEKYSDSIHMPTFVKYMRKENVMKDFLLKEAEKANDLHWLKFDKLKSLILSIPKNERFEFVREVFINKTHIESVDGNETIPLDARKVAMNKLYTLFTGDNAKHNDIHRWYLFAPFDIAFTELKNMIDAEQSNEIKYSILQLLVTSASGNQENIKTLLKYYNAKHMKDDLKLKITFIDHLLSQNNIHNYDQECWNCLNDIFQSIDVYGKTDDNLQKCVTAIIIYKVINNEVVPDTIEARFKFGYFKAYRNKLNEDQNEKLFTYLCQKLTKRFESHIITNKTEYDDAMNLIILAMKLLIVCKKKFTDYPLLDRIKNLLKIKEDNDWDTSLSSIYNFKKTWRKHMFNESILLCPSEEVLLNVLKHKPLLLAGNEYVIESMRCNDKLSLNRLLSKLRIYWTQSLAREWVELYRKRLHQLNGHVSLMRGLFALLAKKQVIEIIEEHTPVETKINWDEIDDLRLSLQRQIAKNMHFARPQPHPNLIMPYAKGGYLQYALPSLYAIFYNLNLNQSKEYVPLLWDAPVSLQKHGFRFAFDYMDTIELKRSFYQTWNQFKNRSIRAVIFKLTHKYLCKDKNERRINDMWHIMESFIKILTTEEDRTIYETLDKVNKIHISVQPKFLKESYIFLKKLTKCDGKKYENYEKSIENLAKYTEEIMDSVDPDFVVDILKEFVEKTFCTERTRDQMTQVLSKYVFYGNHNEDQKIDKLLKPLLQGLINSWNSEQNNEHFVRTNFEDLTWHLQCGVYDQDKHRKMPLKVLWFILSELEKLPIQENYVLIRKWKLIVTLANNYGKLLKTEFIDDFNVKREQIEIKAAPEFGQTCFKILKEDVELYFPCIYVLFVMALDSLYCRFPDEAQAIICKTMLQDEKFIEGHLFTIKLFPRYCYCEKRRIAKEVHDLLRGHATLEVRMHYYNRLNNSYLTSMLESCENNPAKKK